MKLRYFLLPIIIISIMIFIVDRSTVIVNREVSLNNSEIVYPFFDNDIIDEYIYDYINDYIDIGDVLIDYDFYEDNGLYYLTFYRHIFNGNMITNDSDYFIVDIRNDNVKKTDDIVYEFDFFVDDYVDDSSKMIALAFDGGPNYNTNKILDVLEKYNVTATFFVLDNKIVNNEYILERMINSGMEIGNYTIYNGIGENKIKDISKYLMKCWDIDALDWKYHSSRKIANRVINKVRDGDIVRMQNTYSSTANALDLFIPILLDRGYSFVTVSDLFYYKGIILEEDD